jgi:hypothetical protein
MRRSAMKRAHCAWPIVENVQETGGKAGHSSLKCDAGLWHDSNALRLCPCNEAVYLSRCARVKSYFGVVKAG